MAERRMFAKTIIDSDSFLDMPLSTQALYFHLSMRADDDGFINNPRKIQRMVGASEDDLKLLIAKNFIIPFESGIVVIKHWKIHNYIQSDRYKETVYKDEKAMLEVKKNKAYTVTGTECIQNGYIMETQVRFGKDRLGKDSKSINTLARSPDEQDSKPEDCQTQFMLDVKEEMDGQTQDTLDHKTRSVIEQEPEADVAALVLNDGSEWRPSVSLFAEYVRLYPKVDVKQQFNVMRAWCLSNRPKRKTRRGITRFVNSWLAREQDRGYIPTSGSGTNYQQTTKYDPAVFERLENEKRSDFD